MINPARTDIRENPSTKRLARNGRGAVEPQACRSALSSTSATPIRILRLGQVLNLTGLGKTKIYELQAEGDFPMRVKITSHSVGWVEHEVQAWLARRIEASSAQSEL